MTTTTKKRRFVFPNDGSAARTPAERKLEDVFTRFEPELLGTLQHLLGNPDDARDALQEGFVRCWKKRDAVDEIANLRAWVFRVAYNVGLDLLKSGWRRRRKAVAVEELEPAARDGEPEERALERERLAALRDAIRRLDEKEKDVFLLRQNGALTYEQIAQATGLPVGTVKTAMRRALAKLRTADEIAVLRAEERSGEREQNESGSESETKEKDRENAAADGDGASAENGNDAAETER
ncbi:MAG: RNA polymerase sigma factor [Thermoguttaceae bacterium]|nr:RNA polymerase sigma factor [Thermoguttaceae bacterium]